MLRLVGRTKNMKTAAEFLRKLADRYTKTDILTVPLSFKTYTESVSPNLLGDHIFYMDVNQKQMTEKEKENLQLLKQDICRLLGAVPRD